MPSLKLTTNIALSDGARLALDRALRVAVHDVKRDPAAFVAIAIEREALRFGDDDAPAAVVHLHALEMEPAITDALAGRFAAALLAHAAIPASRTYVFFHEVKDPHLIAWHGTTSAARIAQGAWSRQRGRPVDVEVLRATGRLLHPDGAPLSGLTLELWDRDDDGSGTFLGSGTSAADGSFAIDYELRSRRFGDLPDLTLKVYEPDQLANGRRRRYLADLVEAPVNAGISGFSFGDVALPWYEYHPAFPFPYTTLGTGKLEFVGGAADVFAASGRRTDAVAAPLVGAILAGHPPSVAEVQKAFDAEFGTPWTAAHPADASTAAHLADRLLNGFGPQLPKASGDGSGQLLYSACWDRFELNGELDLPDHRAFVDVSGDTPTVTRVELRFRKPGANGRNPAKDDWIVFTPASPQWSQALRVVRATHFNLLAQVKGHVAQAHFNLEQYAIAFFRNVRRSPLRALLFPFLREVVQINSNGQRTLLAADTGALPNNQPLSVPSVAEWVTWTIGEHDWKTFSPRKAAHARHRHAHCAALAWDAIRECVDGFVTENAVEIATHWDEIASMSRDLVAHGLPARREPMESCDDGAGWAVYDRGELVAHDGARAASPIERSANLQDVRQLAAYIIYHSTFFHSWFHQEMMRDLAELAHSSVLTIPALEPRSAEIPAGTAIRTLSTLYTIDGFRFGFLLEDEDGDVPPSLKAAFESRRAQLEAHGYVLEELRARMNS